MFGELSILLLLCFVFLPYFRSVHGCMGMDVWVNVFKLPFLCADSGPWRKMSRAWPAMSAITTSSGSTCPSHQESAWGAVEAIQKGLLWRLLEKALLSGNVALCVEHIYKCFSSVLSKARSPSTWNRPQQHLPSFPAVAHRHIKEDQETKASCLVSWAFSLFRTILVYYLNTFTNVFC